jgi:hypothetical protein
MNTYLYTPKPTLVLKKLGRGVKVRAELEERQLIRSTENARVFYDPDHGILVETDNHQGMEEIEKLFIEKKLPLMYEGEELLRDTYEIGLALLHDLSSQPEIDTERAMTLLNILPESPEATGATGNHV